MKPLLLKALLPVLLLALAACGTRNPTPEKDVCHRAGCSQQYCVPRAEKDRPSTCEWRPEYNCYGVFGQGGVQSSGTCGWFDTPELRACLQNPSAFTGNKMREQLTPRSEPYIERQDPQRYGR